MKLLSRLRFEHYVVAASLAAILLGVLVFGPSAIPRSDVGEELFEGHSRAVTRSGSKALLLLLQRQAVDVERHERRFDLIGRDAGLLISIAPKTPLEPGEAEGLRSWIGEGGTFVLLPGRGEGTREILHEFGLVRKDGSRKGDLSPAAFDLSTVWPRLTLPYRVVARDDDRLVQESDRGIAWSAIARDDAGWIASAGRWGKGQVVVFCDARPARNDALVDGDHDALFVHLAHVAAEDGAVAFDEYHHGHIEGQGPLAFVLDTVAGPAVYHAVAILFLLVMATGRRLGKPLAPREAERRRPMEFLEALARLLRASRNSGLALRLILDDVAGALRARLGSGDPRILAAAAARRGVGPGRILGPLEAAERAAREKPGPAELVRHSRALEEVKRLLAPSKGT